MSKPSTETSTKFGGPFLPFPRWALKSLVGDSVAKAVLLQLLMYMNADTQTTTTSYDHVSEQVGVDRRTVMRAIKRLESVGVLVKVIRKGQGKGMNLSNLYKIKFDNPDIFEVVSLVTLPSDTGDTTSGDSGDTMVVSPVTPNKEYKNKSNTKKNRIKTQNSDFNTLEVDPRWGR